MPKSACGDHRLWSIIGRAQQAGLLLEQQDPDVPWEIALRITEQLCSADVQLHLIKDGNHRLSRDTDLVLLTDVIARLMESL